ncbi:hypothetical protein BN59_00761 [Legionella massiliensis]|uniref:Uncharacterized protein n=1 Tax=Legionella massiliensis TaxID=1034943 RepID=A0A078KU43_9GAMM|nr:hypothetical protein [Legionella massiliensis]CDZ76492.1 hypothetical protein BN59_00761 [Legionella massiliensis]CEE12230.1 hypothetical protein BN1094_00761 [Legionella massiliensis]
MPGIKIHDDNSPLQGAVLFLNATVKAYLEKNENRNDAKFLHLRQMMAQDLYLTDIRLPTEKETYHQVDLVGFKKNGDPVCFTFRATENLAIHQSKETTLGQMSEPSQEMARDIQKHLGFDVGNRQENTL